MKQADPRVPGRTRGREALLATLFAGTTIGTMGALAHLTQAALIFPSLGPTAFLIFYKPTAAAASPRDALIGHALGVGCGVLSLWSCGLLDAPSALEAGVTLPRALAAGLSLGATSGLMVWTRRAHAPAGATTLIVSLGLMHRPEQLAALGVGVVVLLIQGWLIHKAAGTRYPAWRPLPEARDAAR